MGYSRSAARLTLNVSVSFCRADGTGTDETLKADTKGEPRHNVSVCPAACMDIGEIEQERRGQTQFLVQGIIKPNPDRNQPGVIRREQVGVQKTDSALQIQLQPLVEIGQVEPELGLTGETELKEISRRGDLSKRSQGELWCYKIVSVEIGGKGSPVRCVSQESDGTGSGPRAGFRFGGLQGNAAEAGHKP